MTISADEALSPSTRPAYTAYQQRDDLEPYGDNGLLLFVAQLKLAFEDVDDFAANALTDGSNDKKCDLVALSSDRHKLVVAQGYLSPKNGQGAPANKASDLNTAVSWLLSGPLDGLPDTLRSAAAEARDALSDGDVRELQIWYVHNLPESVNVESELKQAAETADGLIRRGFPEANVDVTYQEIGRSTLEEEYRRTQIPILVSETVDFDVPRGFELSADGWSAYSTAISVSELRKLWAAHKTDLMSPNVRDYLGIVRSERNINNGIKETVKTQPENFAIFNNGITVLTHAYQVEATPGSDQARLRVTGVGIVNGGQTTGALGSLPDKDESSLSAAKVMARFVKCTDTEILRNIVRYNNTQNKVEAADFRSKDAIQDRLREEFEAVPDAEYRGRRRGGDSDAIVRRKSLLGDSPVAQALAAFHGDPNLAYNETRTIWINDAVYSTVFRDDVTASHIVYAYALLKAVDRAKQDIMMVAEESRTEAQKKHAIFFSSRGSNYLLVAAVGACIETLLGRAVANKYALRFDKNLSPADAIEVWQPVVNVVLAFSSQLQAAADRGLKSQDRVQGALINFGAMIEAIRSANPVPFDALSDATAKDAGAA